MNALRQETACLRFFGDDLDPAVVTDALGVAASHAWKKDELWSNEGVGDLRPTGAWILDGRWVDFPISMINCMISSKDCRRISPAGDA